MTIDTASVAAIFSPTEALKLIVLTKLVEDLAAQIKQYEDRHNHSSSSRHRCSRRSTPRQHDSSRRSHAGKYCYYHWRFGNDSNRCELPCDHPKSQQSTSGKQSQNLPTTSVSGRACKSRRFYVKDRNAGTHFLIDSGADLSIFPASKADKGRKPLFNLQAANKSLIPAYGGKSLSIDLGLRRNFTCLFIVAEVSQPIIGADFLDNFNLLVDDRHSRLTDAATLLSVHGYRASTPVVSPTYSIQEGQTAYHKLLCKFPNISKPCFREAAVKHNVTHHISTKGPPVHAHPSTFSP